jgi:hypothetical protein
MLKVTNHPFYCKKQNYLASPDEPEVYSEHYLTWKSFKETRIDENKDWNLLFRFDLEEKIIMDFSIGVKKYLLLTLFYVLQRKGHYCFVTIDVTEQELPEVETFLKTRWEHLNKLWTPFSKDNHDPL